MNMELLLLLHEVEQMRSLVSPLYVPSAGPSVPPLILASVSPYSFLASPLGFLQSLTQDILRFVFRWDVGLFPSAPCIESLFTLAILEERNNNFPLEKNFNFYVSIFYSVAPPTWLPWKHSIFCGPLCHFFIGLREAKGTEISSDYLKEAQAMIGL